ncbi:MAG: AzlC family ABC transporter permease [Eubacteriales bacterium]|nr:AzlC family ABC transporter permease [Eubacteriales bacterium]
METTAYNQPKTFFYALRQVLPIIFSYMVVAFAFGIMMQEAGLTWLHALLASIFVYSGSLQIALVPLIVARTPLPVIAVAAFLINSRYMFYGIGFTERFKRQGKLGYPYMIFAFPDEVYCVFCGTNYPRYVDPRLCDRWSAVLCHASWVIGSVIGAAFGNLLPFDLSGIDFAATCLFVCIFVNQWLEFKSHLPMGIGLFAGLLCLILIGASNFMLPALSLSLVLLVIFKERIQLREEANS